MSDLNKLANNLHKYLTESDGRKPKPYDTKAEVLRIEGDTAWVKIPGGVDETPVQRTNNANPGDTVVVRVSGGRAWIAGNNTSPATDDTRANAAYDIGAAAGIAAQVANQAAQNAVADAGVAREAAKEANTLLDGMQTAAEDAGTTLNRIYQDAEDAKTGAESATNSANIALSQLGFVEDIVGVLDLVAKNGVYEPTEDTEVVPDKWYFTRSGTAPDYVYAVVNNPTGDPSAQSWYELTSISDSIQNYVSSHLALVGDTLALKTEGSPYRLELTTSGMRIVGLDGKALAEYGTSTIIGDRRNFHVCIDGEEIGFYNNDTRLAYVNGSELYVTNSLAFGHFTFIERDNGHFTLKLIRSN